MSVMVFLIIRLYIRAIEFATLVERLQKAAWENRTSGKLELGEAAPDRKSNGQILPFNYIHISPKCKHEFTGWRDIKNEEGYIVGGEQVCKKCGMGAMKDSLRNGP